MTVSSGRNVPTATRHPRGFVSLTTVARCFRGTTCTTGAMTSDESWWTASLCPISGPSNGRPRPAHDGGIAASVISTWPRRYGRQNTGDDLTKAAPQQETKLLAYRAASWLEGGI